MSKYFDMLMAFEQKNPFLYKIKVHNCIPYINCRESLLNYLRQETKVIDNINKSYLNTKIELLRIIKSLGKLTFGFKKSSTYIFTSSLYRRDKKRNLVVENLKNKFPDAIVFEWPALNPSLDSMYKEDIYAKDYVPLDYVILLYKIYKFIYRSKIKEWKSECRLLIEEGISKTENISGIDNELYSIIKDMLPEGYASLNIYHKIFSLFFKTKTPARIIDFFGAAKENIYPILNNPPELVEIQHGIITHEHDSYVFPTYITSNSSYLFNRTIYLFGEKYKNIFIEHKNFNITNLIVTGNLRLITYNYVFGKEINKQKYIIFTSQPYGVKYYEKVSYILNTIQNYIENNNSYEGCKIIIKLHPRENNETIKEYRKNLNYKIQIYNQDSELYEILQQSIIHITVTSTVLYEAAYFCVPTVTIDYSEFNSKKIFGFETLHISNSNDVSEIFNKLSVKGNYVNYLEKLKILTSFYNFD